jgi:hypothetical protein
MIQKVMSFSAGQRVVVVVVVAIIVVTVDRSIFSFSFPQFSWSTIPVRSNGSDVHSPLAARHAPVAQLGSVRTYSVPAVGVGTENVLLFYLFYLAGRFFFLVFPGLPRLVAQRNPLCLKGRLWRKFSTSVSPSNVCLLGLEQKLVLVRKFPSFPQTGTQQMRGLPLPHGNPWNEMRRGAANNRDALPAIQR